MRVPGGLFPLNLQRPLIQFLVSLLTIIFISSSIILIAFLLGRIIFGAGAADIDFASETIIQSQRSYLKFFQTMSQVAIFLVPALVISWFMSGNISSWQGLDKKVSPVAIILVILLAIASIPLTSMAGILNSKMNMPSWLHLVEEWMQAKEQQAQYLTSQLVYAAGFGGMLLNILVLALVPAAGEELLFRGIFQQIFQKWLRSGIVAVVVTAILFATLHFQFYGFIPRLILGIIFGLLFLWSRSVWLPFIAHLINNSVPVVLSYYYGWDKINGNVGDYIPSGVTSVIIMIVMPVALIYIIRDYYVQGRWF